MATSLSSLGSLGEYFGKKKNKRVFGQINTWGAGTWIFSMLLTLFCSLQGLSWCKTLSIPSLQVMESHFGACPQIQPCSLCSNFLM